MVICVQARNLMKTFQITLRDGREKTIKAESYRREDDKYVFDGTESGDVEFYVADEVVGITVQPSPDPQLRRWFEDQAERQREMRNRWTLDPNA